MASIIGAAILALHLDQLDRESYRMTSAGGMGGKRDLILWTNDRQVVGKLTEIFNRRWMQKDDVCNYCPRKCIVVT